MYNSSDVTTHLLNTASIFSGPAFTLFSLALALATILNVLNLFANRQLFYDNSIGRVSKWGKLN